MYMPRSLFGDLSTAFDKAIPLSQNISGDRGMSIVVVNKVCCCNVGKEEKVS